MSSDTRREFDPELVEAAIDLGLWGWGVREALWRLEDARPSEREVVRLALRDLESFVAWTTELGSRVQVLEQEVKSLRRRQQRSG